MRRGFLDEIENNYENDTSTYGGRNHERRHEMEERETSQRGSQRRQTNSQSRPKYSQMSQSRLDNINQDLRSIGFKQLTQICCCESNSVDSICDIIKSLIIEYTKAHKRGKENLQNYVQQRSINTRLEKEVEQLRESRAQFIRDKEYLNEKNKGLVREFKEKEDKILKEKEGFVKERKGWSQKEESFKMYTKTMEDKVNNLEKRINKIQKSDKIEYKNTFEVNVAFQKYDRSFLEKDYTQILMQRAIEDQNKFLQQENNELKHLVKEMFEKIQRAAQRIEQQMGTTNYREEIVDISINFSKSKGFPEIMRRYLNIIQEKLSEVRIVTTKKTPAVISNCNEDDLNRQINELKGFYSTWEQINEKRKRVVPGILDILKKKVAIHSMSDIMPLEETTENNEEMENTIEIQSYIDKKMSEYSRELSNINSFTSRLENLRIDLKE